MDREKYKYLMRWLALHEEWRSTLENGTNALKRSDGQMLNGIRNRMRHLITEMEAGGCTLEEVIQEAELNGYEVDAILKELPPVMDETYMKDADGIRKSAKEAWNIYTSSPDYQYLKENIGNLSRGADVNILDRLLKETRFVESLGKAIEKDYLPVMKKYSDVTYYSEQLKRSHELLMMRIDYIQPFHNEKKIKR